MKGLGYIDGFLAERAIGDQEDLVGLNAGAEFFDLFDQVGVDLKSAGGVEDHAIRAGCIGGCKCRGADSCDVPGPAVGVEAELFLLGENLKLVDGGGAVDVAGDDERLVAALF